MTAFFSRNAVLYVAPRCRVCGRGASEAVDIGGTVCDACLRRMNADPQAKRGVILGADIFDV